MTLRHSYLVTLPLKGRQQKKTTEKSSLRVDKSVYTLAEVEKLVRILRK